MMDGFVRIATATPAIQVADCVGNAARVMDLMQEARDLKTQVLVFPELVLTGYTCGDLFLSQTLLSGALAALEKVLAASTGSDMVTIVGLPLAVGPDLFNVAAVLQNGRLLGLVPKLNIPNYAEFYEARQFTAGRPGVMEISLLGQTIPLGSSLLFTCRELPIDICVEICEDLWVAQPPSRSCAAGRPFWPFVRQ
jgi:NAD+ synthase (glutamine-hydrolysing)